MEIRHSSWAKKRSVEYKQSKDYARNLQIWHADQNPVLESILASIQGKDWTKVEGALKFNIALKWHLAEPALPRHYLN